MIVKYLQRLPLPRSLRSQFIFSLTVLVLFVVTGGLVAVYALRVSADSTRQLAQGRLVHMQEAQELVQRTLMIERETNQMLQAQSLESMRSGYANIIERLAALDKVVGQLVSANDDITVLALHQASQLFRNTASIVASLREDELQAEAEQRTRGTPLPSASGVRPSERQAQEANLRQFHSELQRQASAMATSAQDLSAHFTQDYREAVERLADTSQQNQRWVLALLVGSLILAWLVTRYFFGKHVLDRLRQVSHYLRRGDGANAHQRVPVEGSDEIAQMARAVDLFLEDRYQLAQANKALETERAAQDALIRTLAQTQSQLLQSEKLASIGQLAAGVAHEINNPIGFVNSNLSSLRHYMDDLLTLLGAYEAGEGELNDASRAALGKLKKNMDIAFLREDMGSLLSESMDGMQRVRRIVQDLRDFSHVGESEMQWASLEQGLDSTLNVVGSELKLKADVVKEYAGIPEVECVPAQLNQVFMNLLLNAAHAIEGHGTITLRTGRGDDTVWVEVQDTGSGIRPENLGRIFDPFFTTKPVGRGTGLGLSISYGIVQQHGGQISVKSEWGSGSVFRVTLPIHATRPTALRPSPLPSAAPAALHSLH
ncbi:MAG TPA: ATP-binding protein [Rhodoferax sp.]